MTDQVHSLGGSQDQEKLEDAKELHNGRSDGKFEEGQESYFLVLHV